MSNPRRRLHDWIMAAGRENSVSPGKSINASYAMNFAPLYQLYARQSGVFPPYFLVFFQYPYLGKSPEALLERQPGCLAREELHA